MKVEVLVAVVALVAVAIGLALPGPALRHKAPPPAALQTIDLHSS